MGKTLRWEGSLKNKDYVTLDDGRALNLPRLITAQVPIGNRIRIVVEDTGLPDAKTAGQAAYQGNATISVPWNELPDGAKALWDATAVAVLEWAKRNETRDSPKKSEYDEEW